MRQARRHKKPKMAALIECAERRPTGNIAFKGGTENRAEKRTSFRGGASENAESGHSDHVNMALLEALASIGSGPSAAHLRKLGGSARSQHTPQPRPMFENKPSLDRADPSTCGDRGQYSKRRAKAHMRVQMRMPRSTGNAPKKGLGQALWPDSGRHLAARFWPPFGGRNPAASNNSLSGPESGRLLAAGIRPPKRRHLRGHFGQIWGTAVAQLPFNFLAQRGPLCERMQVEFRFDLPQDLANKGRLLQRPQPILQG